MSYARKISAFKLSAAMVLGMAVLPSAVHAQDLVIAHGKGETTLKATPKKAAVYDLASLDILNAIGVDAVAGVPKGANGTGNFPPHINKYSDARYAGVGTLFEPDEAVQKAL